MGFRLLRICDSEEIFEERLLELKNEFLIKIKIIESQFKKVRDLPGADYKEKRMLALQKRVRTIDPKHADRVKAAFDFNPVLPRLSSVFSKHHRTMIADNPELSEVFPDPPMGCLRQGPNLQRILCKAKLSKVTRNAPRATHRTAAGWRRCSATTGRECARCPYAPASATSIISHKTGYTHVIKDPINCKTTLVIYAWRCTKCNKNFTVNTNGRAHQCPNFGAQQQQQHNNTRSSNYIGRSKRQFSTRFGEHIGYIRNNKKEEPSYLHFSQPGHSQHHIQGLGIKHVRSEDPFVIQAREHRIITLFDS